jgi:hypothetical protein
MFRQNRTNSLKHDIANIPNIRSYFKKHPVIRGARGSVVGWGTMLQVGRSGVRVPMRWISFNWPNPSIGTIALGRLSL